VDKRELRRRGVFGVAGRTPSANVEARLNILWRNWAGISAWLSAGAPSIAEKGPLVAACSLQSGAHGYKERQDATSRRWKPSAAHLVVLVTLTFVLLRESRVLVRHSDAAEALTSSV
jgi:hypothetical protein